MFDDLRASECRGGMGRGRWRCQAERGIPEEDVRVCNTTTDFAGGFGCGRSLDNARAETKEEIREGSSVLLEIDAQRRNEFTFCAQLR